MAARQLTPRGKVDAGADVAIVGSGFAGSILARALNRQGLRVLLLERGRHPRFALGESSTPLAAFALERLAARYRLDDLHQLAAYGRWRRHLPHLRRGLKRGFTFFHHRAGAPFQNSDANEARLLVAASPHDGVADSHWLRADVDHHLVERALDEGVDYRDRTALDGVAIDGDGVRLEGRSRGRRAVFTARRVVDASGAGGFLARHLPIAERSARVAVRSGLLYAHFDGVAPFAEVARTAGATITPGPYPDDRAAVHHLLDEGWMYVLPFDHGIASCGIVLRRPPSGWSPARVAADPAGAWHAVLGRYPTLAASFQAATPAMPIRFLPRIQHRLAAAAGPRWALLPHAYAFFDPLYSTGMAWSLLAVERLAEVLAGAGDVDSDLERYGRLLATEADQIEHLVAAAYRAQPDAERFHAVSFLYFAAVSYAELRQRLRPAADGARPDAWHGFLGADDQALRPLFRDALARLETSADDFAAWVREQIAPWNVAGLADPARRNLYPLDLDTLVARAPLLGLSSAAVSAALPRLRGEQRGRE